jgi:hypothetical protein
MAKFNFFMEEVFGFDSSLGSEKLYSMLQGLDYSDVDLDLIEKWNLMDLTANKVTEVR